VFLLEESFNRRLPDLFGYKNDFIVHRLYTILSDGINHKRISFPMYMEKLNMLLLGSEQNKIEFIFMIYDIDNDGLLDGHDLV
jgi:Ca2+-binding EF-hand superfamily protein